MSIIECYRKDNYRGNIYNFNKLRGNRIVEQRFLEVTDHDGRLTNIKFERYLNDDEEEWSDWKVFVILDDGTLQEQILTMRRLKEVQTDMFDLRAILEELNTIYINNRMDSWKL